MKFSGENRGYLLQAITSLLSEVCFRCSSKHNEPFLFAGIEVYRNIFKTKHCNFFRSIVRVTNSQPRLAAPKNGLPHKSADGFVPAVVEFLSKEDLQEEFKVKSREIAACFISLKATEIQKTLIYPGLLTMPRADTGRNSSRDHHVAISYLQWTYMGCFFDGFMCNF